VRVKLFPQRVHHRSVGINSLNSDSRLIVGANKHSRFTATGKVLPRYCAVLLFMILIANSALAQITLRGIVLDTTSMFSLSSVNITIKNKGQGTESDIRGTFELKASEKDTIIFSIVGYQTRMIPAEAVGKLVLIFMKEEPRMLDEVEIKSLRPPWMPPLEPVSPWQNLTLTRPFTEVPATQGVQTFGPGYTFKMPGSGFKKEARAKKRLREIEEENNKASHYITMINGAEIKGKLMNEYGLSEEQFYEILARFNQKNGDFIYKLEWHEVLPLLLQFFADEAEQR
jgi:hypothetical protein